MRTKNKKWTVPILAIVPVLALAAFLVAGSLPGGSDLPTVEAQSFDTTTDDVTGKRCEVDAEGTSDMADGPCTTSETSLDVVLFVDGTGAVNRRVYVTGGDDFSKVQASSGRRGVQR